MGLDRTERQDGREDGRGGGTVTFRGRGLARRAGAGFVLLVCPLCSQRNAPPASERGVCAWCAYEPSPADAEPSSPAAECPRAA